MASSAPAPESQGKAGATSANAEKQPASAGQQVRERPEPPLPSVPDHELLRCIGRGAYGAVWLARNVMGLYRAVKILHRDDFGRDRPFTREYEGLLNYEPISRSHPNLMQILHVGRRERYFYYVMELADDAAKSEERGQRTEDGGLRAEGTLTQGVTAASVVSYVPRTLQEDLERRGRLPIRECVSLATALASALKHLHEHKLVHRDVKPANVIFVHGVPKLADVGLVATVGDSRSIVGTEGYLPPEGPGTPQADLYGLGKLLYEASTGKSRGEYPRLPQNLSALPDAQELLEFNEVLLRACAKDTNRRYHQTEDLLADLALLERGDSVKRLRRLERHHALLKRIGVGVLVVGLLASVSWWQSWRAHRIANRHLARLHVNEGTRRMAQGDYAAALPWLVGALQLETGDARLEAVHRTRIASVLQRCPVPVAHFSEPGSKVVTADLSPDARVVATAHEDGCVRLWDTRSASEIQQLPDTFPVALCQFLPSGDRLLTLTLSQEARIWNLNQQGLAPLTFVQAQGFGGQGYGVGLNEKLSRAYLFKGHYGFARFQHPYTGPFSNVTLGLKLIGKGEELLARYEVRRALPDNRILCTGEFLDTPEADAFDAGSDNPVDPLWGRMFLVLENPSWAESPGTPGEVIWDNLRLRRYRTGEPPPAWQVLDDFSGGRLTNWNHFAVAEEGRSFQVVNRQFVHTCSNLPASHSASGCVLYREPFEISRTHTLEVEVDLVSVRAPHPVVNLALFRVGFDPFSARDRPFVAHGRWLCTTFWDEPIRIWDLEKAWPPSIRQELEPGAVGVVRDMDFSPDTNYLAVVWTPNVLTDVTNCLRVWHFQTGLEVQLDGVVRTGVSAARFSPDLPFLAVCRENSLELLCTTDWRPAMNLATGASFECPRFSPRGNRLAAVRDELDIVVWDLGDARQPPMSFPQPAPVRRIIFSPSGRYLAASVGGAMLRILDLVRGEQLGPPLPGALARFSPDGTQVLVFGGDNGAWLWDLSRIADNTLAVPPLRGAPASVASADHTLTAEIQGQGIALKTPGGEDSLVLPDQAPLRRVAFTADGQNLIAESADGRGYVWEVRQHTLLQPPRSVCYDVSLESHSLPNLLRELRGRQTLSDLAALLGHQRSDGRGGMTPVEEEERTQLFAQLKRRFPEEFAVDDRKRLRWHYEHAQAGELAMGWDEAVFHWERARGGESKVRSPQSERSPSAVSRIGNPWSEIQDPKIGISMEGRLAYARQAARMVRTAILAGNSRWSVILPRPPWTGPEMLDLTALYTQALGEPVSKRRGALSFRGLPSADQLLGGTAFDVRGLIDLGTTTPVTVPVGRPCQRLHFLHAARTRIFNREKVGSCEVTYAHGEKEVVDFLSPDDVPPFTSDRFHEIAAVSRTNASGLRVALAWSGCALGPAKRKEPLYLTRATWDLPARHQGEVIQSIQLRAGPGRSALLLFAITVE